MKEPKNAAMTLAFVRAVQGRNLDGRRAVPKAVNRVVRAATNGEIRKVR